MLVTNMFLYVTYNGNKSVWAGHSRALCRLCSAQREVRRRNETESTRTPPAEPGIPVQCWTHLRKSPSPQFARRCCLACSSLALGWQLHLWSQRPTVLHSPNPWVGVVQVDDQENGPFLPSFEALESELESHSTSLVCDLRQVVWLLWASVSSVITRP